MNKMKKVISIPGMLTAIILMMTPFGVAMKFSDGPDEYLIRYYSYFSMMPVGASGNWLPAIVAFLSIVTLVLLLIGIKNAKMKKSVQICLSLCIAAMVVSWLLFGSFTVLSACIMAIHILVLALQTSRNCCKAQEQATDENAFEL